MLAYFLYVDFGMILLDVFFGTLSIIFVIDLVQRNSHVGSGGDFGRR